MNENSAVENDDDNIYLAKKLMDAIDNGSNDQLHNLFKIAHLNPKIFVHCEKYFQKGIESDIDKYECLSDYGLIQMLKGNDPIEYFKKSYEEGQSENGLFNYAVFTKRKDLLKESADKYENPFSMLLYYQLTNDINYLQKSAIKYKNPFALTLYGLYKIEDESKSKLDINSNNNNDIPEKKDSNNDNNNNENSEIEEKENVNKIGENDNRNSIESNKSKIKEEDDANDDDVNNENNSEEEEESIDDIYNDGQRILTEAAILTKPGDKSNLLPFPSVLFYSKEFINECKNNIKRAADAGNPHCAFLYAYMTTDLQEKSKYYKYAGDNGLSDGYYQYYKLVRKNSSLFTPDQFDNLPRNSDSKPIIPNSIEKVSQKEENKKPNILNDNKEVIPSNFEFEMKRFIGEMDHFIDFQRSIFDITINSVPTVSQNIVSTIVDVKSVYKLVHNIMLAVDYRPFEQNLNALANLATSIHFLIFDEYLQNLFRDLLIQEACSNTSRNRSRFFFIELCIENFMFSMDYFCKAVSYIKQFRQKVNYNRYIELWFPEVRKFIIKIERENQNQKESENEEEEETESEKENETEIEKENKNDKENENKDENKTENEKDNKTENENKTDNENEVKTEKDTKSETKLETKNDGENVNEPKKEKDETSKDEKDKNDVVDDDFIDLNYFFDTKKHIDDANHNTQSNSDSKENNENESEAKNSFYFLPFRDSTLVSASFIISHRKQGNPDPLSQAIRHDDINKLKKLLMQGKKTNINARIQPSFFELSSMLDKRPSLLCYCAFFNAEKCFSFLVDNEADTLVFDDECLTVTAYASASGSTKILARLEAVNELEHQEAAEFASRFHHGRILKRLMSGKTMCGAAAEEMKENQKSIANEILERQKRQMMQELQIRRILIQQQKFIQQQEMINQRNMKLQQEEQKLKLERFLIQQQQKIRLQQEQQKKQQQQQQKEQQKDSDKDKDEKTAGLSNQTEINDKENEEASKNTHQNEQQSNEQVENQNPQANIQVSTPDSSSSENQSQKQTSISSEPSNQAEKSPSQNQQNIQSTNQTEKSTETTKQTEIQQTNQPTSSQSEPSNQTENQHQTLSPPKNPSDSSIAPTSSNPAKRSSFFGKYADLQKQVLLEQRKQQLLKQQHQEQLKSQAAQKSAEIHSQSQSQDLSLPPALAKLVASQTQQQQSQQNQEPNFITFHRRPNPYKQDPIEEKREEFVVKDGEPKVEEIEKVVVNGLLSDFVESLSYFDSSEKPKTKPKQSNKSENKNRDENENEEEEEEEEKDDDDDEEEDENEIDDGLLPLFSEDLNGDDSSASIFYKICELGNSGVVHFFNQEIWKRMLIETIHGDERETVLTRLAAIGNYDMLDELLKIKEVKKLINVANLNGNTPIEVAAVNKHQNIVDVFESFLDEQE